MIVLCLGDYLHSLCKKFLHITIHHKYISVPGNAGFILLLVFRVRQCGQKIIFVMVTFYTFTFG